MMRTLLFFAAVLSFVAAPAAEAGRNSKSRGKSNKGVVVKLDGRRSRAPAEWLHVSHASPPRQHHFMLPRANGDDRDAELIIFYFGKRMGGSAEANIARWKTIFEPPRGKSIEDVSRVKVRQVSGLKITTLELRGTYLYRSRPVDPLITAEKRKNHRMLSTMIESENGPYFIRLVGPDRTVKRHKKRFEAWLKAFK